MKTQFPFHPVSGQRLVRTIDTVLIFNTARIANVDGKDHVDVIDAIGINPSDTEQTHIDHSPFVATAAGAVCLLSEAVWSDLDVDHLEGFSSKTNGTPLPSLNEALANLVELGEASETVLATWAEGDLAGAVNDLEGVLAAIPLLGDHTSAVS